MKKLFRIIGIFMCLSVGMGITLELLYQDKNPIYKAMVLAPMMILFVALIIYIIYNFIFDDF